ncbi:MAG: arginine deiminase family protein [bacterium]
MTLIAVTRAVSPSLADCELTHLERVPLDVGVAEAQHAAYESLLHTLGATIVRAPAAPELPDAVFIEDTAVVLDEVAVITRPGALARRAESMGVEPVVQRYRPVVVIDAPGTLDGGDVMRVGRTLYVGRSSRTNDEGIDALQRLVREYGYHVVPTQFSGCLHLKSAVSAVADGVLLMNPTWVAARAFSGCEAIAIDAREPAAANALWIADSVVYSSQYPRTRDTLVRRGLHVAALDYSELAKAEGAVTCCSLVFDA